MANSQFNIEAFRRHLSTQWMGQSIRYFPELESTSTYAKNIPKEDLVHGMLCITDKQTRGRGQYNREWKSGSGQNLVFSLVLTPQKKEGFHVLTLAAALSVVEQLNEIIEKKDCACIKWPNDVMLNDRKVAGILTETVFSGNEIERLIIGIGLNVNQKEFSAELSGNATSVFLEKGEKISREKLLSKILSRFEYKYRLWQHNKEELLKIINKNIAGYGQWITLRVNGETREDAYKMLGINETGQLLVLNKDAEIETFAYEQIRIVSH